MNVSFKKATKKDLIINLHFRFLNQLKAIDFEFEDVIIAQLNNNIIGFCIYDDSGVSYFEVNHKLQKQGIATKLFDYYYDLVLSKSYDMSYILALQGSYDFWIKLGYEPVSYADNLTLEEIKTKEDYDFFFNKDKYLKNRLTRLEK